MMSLLIFIRCRCQQYLLCLHAATNRNILRLFVIRGCRLLLLLLSLSGLGSFIDSAAGSDGGCIAVDYDLFNDRCNDFVLLWYIFCNNLMILLSLLTAIWQLLMDSCLLVTTGLLLSHISVYRYTLFREASGFGRALTLFTIALFGGGHHGGRRYKSPFCRSLGVLIAWNHYLNCLCACGRDLIGSTRRWLRRTPSTITTLITEVGRCRLLAILLVYGLLLRGLRGIGWLR